MQMFFAGTAAFDGVAVAYAVATVVCAVTIAYVTADAMLCMLLHSVSVAVTCAAAVIGLAASCAVLFPLHMLFISLVQLSLAIAACAVAFVYMYAINIVYSIALCSCC